MRINSLRAVILAWLNAFQKSWVGVGMKWSVSSEVISVVSGVANCIPRYIRTYLHFSIQQRGNEGGGVIPRFQDFPPVIFLGLFLCHREYIEVFETSEIAFVAICGRSRYKMPGLQNQYSCQIISLTVYYAHYGGAVSGPVHIFCTWIKVQVPGEKATQVEVKVLTKKCTWSTSTK